LVVLVVEVVMVVEVKKVTEITTSNFVVITTKPQICYFSRIAGSGFLNISTKMLRKIVIVK
jgi:branched-subunit amino acid aminotransferase/4-amino-4-deoxychorismate lyase